MELLEVTDKEFEKIILQPYHVYNSSAFNRLNKNKCDDLFFFLFKDNKFRLGLIVGLKDTEWLSPFSAPFGGFSFLKEDISIQYIESAVDLFDSHAKNKKIKMIEFILPPIFYSDIFLSKLINVYFRRNYQIVNYDLDYYYDVAKFNENYIQSIWHNARKNLKIAFKNELSFRKCASAAEMRKSYEIIQKNREVQGYPLKMSLDQIAETQNVIEVDSFIVSKNGLDIASAIVFRVAKDIVQVIYWGNILEYSDLKGMNFLSFKIFEYYSQRNIRFVDVGPATENSLPNYGLCEFKESIGCNIMPRYKIQKKVS